MFRGIEIVTHLSLGPVQFISVLQLAWVVIAIIIVRVVVFVKLIILLVRLVIQISILFIMIRHYSTCSWMKRKRPR